MRDALVRRRTALFVILTDVPNGAERVTANFAVALAQRPDWDVTVQIVCNRKSPSFGDSLKAHGITVRHGPYPRERISTPVFLLSLPRRRYDLVFSSILHMNGLLAAARRIGWLRTARLVTRESNVLADRYQGTALAIRSLFLKAYGPQALIVVQSDHMGKALRPLLSPRMRARVRMLPNPTDVATVRTRAAAPLAPELEARLTARSHLFWMGRLIDWKRPELAVDVLARVRALTGMDLGLVILGEGQRMTTVRERIAAHGLEDQVILPGRQDNPFNIAARCRLGFSTSLGLEGFPNVLLEMMAAGVPAVVTTPCADGLRSLPGVSVTDGFEGEELVQAITAALMSGADHRASYAEELERRSAKASLPVLLGEVP